MLLIGATGFSGTAQANTATHELLKPEGGFSWTGVFGRYDRASLKRGWQVYHEVCANCHGLKLVAFRNLAAVGLTPEEIKAIAAEKEVQDGPNDEGAMFQRPARPSDRMLSPYANDKVAASIHGGAVPPDLSLITKARVNGPNYVYSLLLGYPDVLPEDAAIPEGKMYNTYFPGYAIGMPQQVFEDAVSYADGTKATKEQIAKDVVTFLNWAAEPELEARKSLGVKVMVFLALLTALLFALKRQIWKDVH
ncbi:cytochrome c1 [Magnetospirillum fulvum]|nr:cytochrome c1 [Magnetospirillum fulvum]